MRSSNSPLRATATSTPSPFSVKPPYTKSAASKTRRVGRLRSTTSAAAKVLLLLTVVCALSTMAFMLYSVETDHQVRSSLRGSINAAADALGSISSYLDFKARDQLAQEHEMELELELEKVYLEPGMTDKAPDPEGLGAERQRQDELQGGVAEKALVEEKEDAEGGQSYVPNGGGATTPVVLHFKSSAPVDPPSYEVSDGTTPFVMPKHMTNYVPHSPVTFFKVMSKLGSPAEFCPSISQDKIDLELTLVTHGSSSRLWLVPEICRRFKGKMIVVAWLSTREASNGHLDAFGIGSKSNFDALCPNVRIISYFYDPSSAADDDKNTAANSIIEYPVNVLRNAGIMAVTTTHFLMIDIDFVPSSNLADAFNKHRELLLDPMQALVVPAFERRGKSLCDGSDTSKSCLDFFVDEKNEFVVPNSFSELQACVAKNSCKTFEGGNNPDGHSTSDSRTWIENNFDHVRRVECFDSTRYEPYVIMRRCDGLENNNVLYDERFTGYGKNKIEWVAHVRHMGFIFSILGKAFVIHLPHKDSASKQIWLLENSSHQKEMDQLYSKFLRDLKKRFGQKPTVPICDFYMDVEIEWNHKKSIMRKKNIT